eukprot:Skav203344  [mRNA]  locus=scaffold464:139232:140871:- [translate_table: standard]
MVLFVNYLDAPWRVPLGSSVYVSIDIDGLDPSIAPGTGTPSHGGFLYYEDLLRQLISRTRLVGLDLVEVAPPYDPAGVTTTLAARLVLDAMGFAMGPSSTGATAATEL